MDMELLAKVRSFIDDWWTKHGMTDMGEIKKWLDIGIWDAKVAKELHEAGVTPRQTARAAWALRNILGIDRHDSNYYIHAVCSGDVPVDIIIKTAHMMNKLTMMLKIYEAPYSSNYEEFYTELWHGRGFHPFDIDYWCSVGVWNSEVAAQLRQAGIGPADVVRAERWLIKNSERDYPNGSPIWAACNGDIPVQVIIDAAKESLQRKNDPKEKEMTASIDQA
jgi:hypothetical protein